MYCKFRLLPTQQQVIAPVNWVQNFNWQNFVNYGPSTSKTQVLFMSNEQARQPNFNLVPSKPEEFWYKFDNGVEACFIGRVEILFGKYTFWYIIVL